jgi:hypothetical protein
MQSQISRRTRAYALLAALLVLFMAVAACTQPPPAPAASQGISAQNAWARPAKMMGSTPMEGDAQQMQHGGANSAVYLVLANGGGAADRLIAAQADVSNAVEIHETKMEGDVMRMAQVEGGIELPAGGQVELKPGGYHVMLIGLTRDLNVGEKFPVTLQFESGNSLVVEAEVRQP